jgi:hypothetical protein
MDNAAVEAEEVATIEVFHAPGLNGLSCSWPRKREIYGAALHVARSRLTAQSDVTGEPS